MAEKSHRNRRRWPLAGAGIAAAVALGGLGWVYTGADDIQGARADPHDPDQVALGQNVYAKHCSACHGTDLEGQPNWRQRKPDGKLPAPPHDATGHTWHHPDAQLFAITKHGVKPPLAPEGYESDMRAFGDALTDEEIWAALAYIKSTWPREIRERQAMISRQAEQ
jgi:mono/diheme cytochrome c family protein